ncbi:sensor histidine kinase [Chromobacterium amazonense]|uniref:histidine kinase n=1 Tax=Chromobacterium amazonense TaxID=1382803 RepID=A0A2S9X6I8_9NEIS|nr:sensor histidine kinase [Chromobacterium amazonense]PRP71295.1 sensor histidine kinase [Chromobacterium amazonense]
MLVELSLVLSLLQQMCVYLVIAYLLSKTPLFMPLTQVTLRLPHRLACYVVFSMFCIMGTYFGLHIDDSIANTRAIGAALGGMLGGPWVGLAVGFTGGLHRYSLGGLTAGACMVSTMVEGLLGGLVHLYLVRKGKRAKLFDPLVVALTALAAEVCQMAILLALVRPFHAAEHLVESIALPMMIANTLGAGMFMRILLDRRALATQYSTAFSSKALQIAARAEGVLRQGFNRENSMTVARILYEELGVGAVAITDREHLLAFIGIGDDHHKPGTAITSPHTHRAIEHNQVVYADGEEVPYRCSLHPQCKLASSLVIPLRGEDERVIGTIKLYEPRNKLISHINLTLGEGIARLLSSQILQGRYDQQKQLLAQTEIKLLHAQVNPHFLFNALNTLSAVIRRNPEHARQLVQYLSTFFRKNLKRSSEVATLADEIEHVSAYLHIEEARFAGRLHVDIELAEDARQVQLPAFSLQPIVENAIKHGTSQLLEPGRIRIGARCDQGALRVTVEDNAGLYAPAGPSDGMGMSLVDRRIRARHGPGYGVTVECQPEAYTRVTLTVPCPCPGELPC